MIHRNEEFRTLANRGWEKVMSYRLLFQTLDPSLTLNLIVEAVYSWRHYYTMNHLRTVGVTEDDSQQRNDVFLRRLEELEASIDKVCAGVRMFEPSVPMIGTGSKSIKGINRNGGSDLIGQADDSEFTDPEATGTSGSEATEVMLDLDDSTVDAPSFGGR